MMFQKLSFFPVIAVIIICQLLVIPIAVSAEDTIASDGTTTSQPEQSAPEIATEPVAREEIPVLVSNDETNLENLNLFPEVLQDLTPTPELTEPADKTEEIAPIISEIETPQPLATVSAPTKPYELPNNPLCEGLTGDLNGDGLLNKYDEEVMSRMTKGLEPFSACADLDQDGFISAGDISILISTYKIDMPANGIILQPIISAPADSTQSIIKVNNSCTIGDTNNDNQIDYKDAGLLLQMMKGELPSIISADLDGDGYIGPGDLSMLENEIRIFRTSAEVSVAEQGNCNAPTAAISYSRNDGLTYTPTLSANADEIIKIKATFSQDIGELDYILLSVDNGLGTNLYMQRQSSNEFIYDLVAPKSNIPTATVTVKKIRGVFENQISLTAGSTFSISFLSRSDAYRRNHGGQILCEAVTYSDWSACNEGKQTRTIIGYEPENCLWTPEQPDILEQSCHLEPEIIEAAPVFIEPIFEPTVEAQLLKSYPEGTLLRAFNDVKIYIIQNNFKRHIQSLEELAKLYFGQTIHNVSPKILNQYQTIK